MSEDFEDEIFQIIENQNINPEVRLAAIETFRRLPCEDYRTYFQTLYSDRDENVEVRISSYLQFMKCPNYLTIRTLRNSLLNEDVNQGTKLLTVLFVLFTTFLVICSGFFRLDAPEQSVEECHSVQG